MTSSDKAIAHARAVAALEGFLAYPSQDERGRRTVILTAGPCTREILPEQLEAALEDCRARRANGEVA